MNWFAWQNGLTHAWVYFCGRYCASKYGISWAEPRPYPNRPCALCGSP